jgi:precorrin-3B synthase
MSGVAVKGWCPSALRPMQSGDGLVVRLRPRGGRITSAQAAGIAELAGRYGNGLIDLTARANLQLRGVREQGHAPLVEALAELSLIDSDLETESQRNILVVPFWHDGDDTQMLAAELEQKLAAKPLGVSAKFGFAIDCGAERVLAQASADIRIERGADGGLIVRTDGAEQGSPVTRGEAVDRAFELAKWFVASGGAKDGRGRMAAHLADGATLPKSLDGSAGPAPAVAPPRPGIRPAGALIGLGFGQMRDTTLRFLARQSAGLRMTPWRMILAESLREMPLYEGLVTRADDPMLRVVACTGAPGCQEAHVETRSLAATLAPYLPEDGLLHVAGCAKGCAHPTAAPVTLVGTRSGFDLIRNGSAHDAPRRCGLQPADIIANPAMLVGVG